MTIRRPAALARALLTLSVALAACNSEGGGDGACPECSADLLAPRRDLAAATDLAPRDGALALDGDRGADGGPGDLGAPPSDLAATSSDLAAAPSDLAKPVDLAPASDLAPVGPLTGGPCLSGAPGATALRFGFTNSAGAATVKYEVLGLPDKTRWKVGVYGYQFGFTPAYVDMFLAQGGLQLDGSDFIDVELSTSGLKSINSATLAIYGRSYSVGTSGSFRWQTFSGVGNTPTDLVSNTTPYRWYGGDASASFVPGDPGVLLRIKAGPSSNALVVNRVELCMEAK